MTILYESDAVFEETAELPTEAPSTKNSTLPCGDWPSTAVGDTVATNVTQSLYCPLVGRTPVEVAWASTVSVPVP